MKVLVTGATRNSSMAVIRALAREGCEVIGADERSLPFKAHSCYTAPYHIYPPLQTDAFVDVISDIVQKEKPDVFLPVAGSLQVSKHKRQFKKFTKILLPDLDIFMKAFDNRQTLETCQKLGIGCPTIWHENDVLAEIEKNKTRKLPLRFVLKPRMDIGGARGLFFVDSETSFFKSIKAGKRFGEMFISEYIPGPTENMRTVNLLFDAGSQLIAYFTTQKIRQWPNSGGVSALNISTQATDLVDFILPFFKKINWQGFAEAEIKIDERDGMPKLIEINPRFCGYIGFPIACGINFPWYICQLLNGGKPEVNNYAPGIQYIHWSTYIKAVSAEWRKTGDKAAFLKKIRSEITGKKVSNNMHWRDWRIIAAKILYELKDRGRSADVWN